MWSYYRDGTINPHDKIRSFREGSWIYYFDNGSVRDKGDYKYDRRDGKWISYYPNGTVAEEGEYKDGKKHGLWTYNKPNGAVDETRAETWVNGIRKQN